MHPETGVTLSAVFFPRPPFPFLNIFSLSRRLVLDGCITFLRKKKALSLPLPTVLPSSPFIFLLSSTSSFSALDVELRNLFCIFCTILFLPYGGRQPPLAFGNPSFLFLKYGKSHS